ncbi:acyl-CoA N-acyltransferase [Globomyces pollinis-pini]|nr:acyl-CoA N-acyltransferase [Globomyces pollinis-pini]
MKRHQQYNSSHYYWNNPQTNIIPNKLQVAAAAEPPNIVEYFDLTRDNLNIAVQLHSIHKHNLEEFKNLNLSLFPVVYNQKFYKDIIETHPPAFSRLAYMDSRVIGAISCRQELVDGVCRVYIMTLGVLDPFRKLGLGSLLLSRILDVCQKDETVDHILLHVHVSNLNAIRFYKRNGFSIQTVVEGYYEKNAGVNPPDAFILKKSMTQLSVTNSNSY